MNDSVPANVRYLLITVVGLISVIAAILATVLKVSTGTRLADAVLVCGGPAFGATLGLGLTFLSTAKLI
ncbi:hypothetical protein V6U90_14065 [Micromonospora sp. CPCC 206060]|uniref:hypothetical protein n=1 Tax=Micromonospora sp. CPCC 206060 TaxID=3122406 RepID=UPI002FEF9E23